MLFANWNVIITTWRERTLTYANNFHVQLVFVNFTLRIITEEHICCYFCYITTLTSRQAKYKKIKNICDIIIHEILFL